MKRSISDVEIGLIRAMLTRGMKNQSIQFYFNRQDRPVNSGRITQIRQDTYGAGIPSATDAALESFLTAFLPGSVTSPSTPPPTSREDGIVAMFAPTNDGGWRLTSGETDELECKRDFDLKKPASVVRAIAGMANNKGGTILLGVEDKSGKVVGLPDDNFAKIDLVKLTLAVKAHLQPTPSFFKGVVASCTAPERDSTMERSCSAIPPKRRPSNSAILKPCWTSEMHAG